MLECWLNGDGCFWSSGVKLAQQLRAPHFFVIDMKKAAESTANTICDFLQDIFREKKVTREEWTGRFFTLCFGEVKPKEEVLSIAATVWVTVKSREFTKFSIFRAIVD